jgi:hypothetical protein
MRPTLKFRATKESLIRQTENLEKWWNENKDRVLEAMDYYISCRWRVDSIQVLIAQLSKKGSKATTYECEGEVFIDEPDMIHISIGTRVRWTKRNLCVFIHELIHCATHSHKDKRYNKPGLLEYWILDELATDLLAQCILKKAVGFKPKIGDSIEYALVDTSNRLVKDRELQDELVRRVKKELRSYLRTEKKFYSFRKNLKNV